MSSGDFIDCDVVIHLLHEMTLHRVWWHEVICLLHYVTPRCMWWHDTARRRDTWCVVFTSCHDTYLFVVMWCVYCLSWHLAACVLDFSPLMRAGSHESFFDPPLSPPSPPPEPVTPVAPECIAPPADSPSILPAVTPGNPTRVYLVITQPGLCGDGLFSMFVWLFGVFAVKNWSCTCEYCTIMYCFDGRRYMEEGLHETHTAGSRTAKDQLEGGEWLRPLAAASFIL